MDGGVRCGQDVFKAVALGAKGVVSETRSCCRCAAVGHCGDQDESNLKAIAVLTPHSPQMIGRPWLYALGSAGGAGVTQMLELMRWASSSLNLITTAATVSSSSTVVITPYFLSEKSWCAQWAWLASAASRT